MLARPPHLSETSTTLWVLVYDVVSQPRQNTTKGGRDDGPHTTASSIPCDHETEDATPIRCHIVLDEVNASLLQYALNRLNIPHILAGNTNVTLDLAVTVLNDFELKRDAIQAENYMPAR